MKKVLGVVIVTIILSVLFHQCKKTDGGLITGLVTDSITHRGVEGVSVSVIIGSSVKSGNNSGNILRVSETGNVNTKASQIATTGKDGRYTLEETGLGNLTLQFNRNGYNTTSKKVFIATGRGYQVDMVIGPAKPEVETGAVSNKTESSATVAGTIKDIGIDNITQYGHCWSYTTSTPTITNCNGKTTKGATASAISFSSQLTDLQLERNYYIRAYATNKAGTTYGTTKVFTTGSIAILDEGLIAYYPFNGNFEEESGTGLPSPYKIVNYPSFVTDRLGNPNSACQFDGSYNDCLYVYTYPYFNNLNDFTISLWFNKPGAWENAYQKLFTIGYSSILQAYISQGPSPNNFYYGIRLGGIDYQIVLSSYPSANQWHHLVALRKGSQMELYIDGLLRGDTACSSSTINNYNWMFIGFTWYTEPFRGKLDELRLYNRALNASEIQYLSTH